MSTPRTTRTITCLACDQERRHSARGLCSGCYQSAKTEGRLDDYPTIRWGTADQYAEDVALTGGYWRADKHGIQRWHPDTVTLHSEPKPKRKPRKPKPITLTDDERRAGHSRYVHGKRDKATLAAEAAYQLARRRAREERAA